MALQAVYMLKNTYLSKLKDYPKSDIKKKKIIQKI